MTEMISSVTALTAESSLLFIPLDFSRHNRTYSFSSAELSLSQDLNERLEAALRDQGEATAVFGAVYFALLYRLSGEKEIMAGWTSNEDRGFPVLLNFDEENRTFDRLVHNLKQHLASARPAGEPEFDTRFSVNFPIQADRELLNWQLIEHEGSWQIKADYDRSILTETTIRRYMQYYLTLLDAALADQAGLIAAVDILTDEDKAVYGRMNDTVWPYDKSQTIHGMFEKAAAQFPDHIALSSIHGKLTYRELNERANRMARLLLDKGLTKGGFVTLFMERSLELVISLLGILKAGGVYVPVDPEHPEDRNRYILSDTESAFVLTKTQYLSEAKHLCAEISTVKEILAVDAGIMNAIDGSENTGVHVAPDDLAYVIYTSGSTGRPKGALIAHEGVVNLGETVRTDCQIEPEDVLTQFATYSFDASVWDTIGALFYGAHLYLLAPEERVSVEEFASAIERTGTTIITILPTVFFNQLSTYLSDEGYRKLSRVKLITVAGEALYGEQVRAFQRKFRDGIDIVNVYGPTECTVCTTTHKITGYIPDSLTNVPIGRPIHNYKVYIVNEENQLCPLHVHGEVYIATVGLAKGYLNQPEKTAAAFIPNPFGEGQIYKSGDIAKLLPDGTVEYVGRRDSQIKIRGHRIEIGEIEDSFAKIPNVQHAAVVCKKDADGQNMLAGYFASKDGGLLSTTEIKRMLGDKLPSYFVPKWIVQLTEMPTSPTGKIDRKRLLAMEHQGQTGDEEFVPPVSEVERRVAHSWEQALKLGRVSRHDDFFAIGGDSLAIIQVLVILKPHYPNLKINDFFQYRTVDAIAARIEELLTGEQETLGFSAYSGPAIKLDEHPAIPGGDVGELASAPMSAVLLTGSTGYLGSYLLHELLVKSEAVVYCLVRPGLEAGIKRIRSNMEFFFGSGIAEQLEGRVVAVEGDLEKLQLGLRDEDRQKLIVALDAIIHSAADVRHFGDEEQFAKTNIAGTLSLIELARACTRKVHFHHISTLGIPEDLALSGQWDTVVEQQKLDSDLRVDNLYTQSKMAAEKAVISAGEAGLNISVYRAGNLSCHSETGLFQKNIDSNSFYRMIKAMLLLGKAPEVSWEMDFTPINYAAEAIVQLALQQGSVSRMFHICNPKTIAYAQWIDMIRGCGYEIQALAPSAYTAWLFDEHVPKNLEGVQLAIAQLEGDGAKDSPFRYGCDLTSETLEKFGVRCAEPDRQLMTKMIDYAVKIGYFPRPKVLQQG
ncbi:amino acid adenylation domain-containing protein [Paenibacillus sp. GCM10012307]|uniref:Amino acid adenylation domain-containing protein n=1 Tax=Paenibacillus roseus TaxID=2798579 RepID=A0A934J6X6_9BACL|nr:non-ribosomal peptide synthetase [Paenibacillus roseus]MBJ6362748.1 amino acid adenylation domain-containing protein [Paenibacillus roseus]